jgi:uncharacterized protein (TIGR02271 family)
MVLALRRALPCTGKSGRPGNCVLVPPFPNKSKLSMANSFNNADARDRGMALMDAPLRDAGGRQASVVSIDSSGLEAHAWVRVHDGPQLLVPLSLFAPQSDGSYRLPFAFAATTGTDGEAQMTFPVLQEDITVGKRVIDSGRGVRLHKTVSESEQVIDETLLHDELEVQRVPVGAMVMTEEAPRMRYEGDTLVVPILEEVLVVQKKLRLKEEVRITRHKREVHMPQTVSLRSEHIDVERFDQAGMAATQARAGKTGLL